MIPQPLPSRSSLERVLAAAIGAVLLASCTAPPAHAQQRTGRDFPPGLNIHLEYSYYDVHGTGPREIHQSMISGGPRVDNQVYFALTAVETGFRYRQVEEDGLCRLETVGVEARVVMRLPQWKSSAGASPRVRSAWDDFLRDLMRHEAEHYRIIESGARQIYNALLDLRAHSCRLLEAKAKQAIREISDAQEAENKMLDLRTDHGASDGAVWPPDDFLSIP